MGGERQTQVAAAQFPFPQEQRILAAEVRVFTLSQVLEVRV
jgi:hypothetical protein